MAMLINPVFESNVSPDSHEYPLGKSWKPPSPIPLKGEFESLRHQSLGRFDMLKNHLQVIEKNARI